MPTPKMIYLSEELDSAQCKAENIEEERDSLQAENERLRGALESRDDEANECEVKLHSQLAELREAAGAVCSQIEADLAEYRAGCIIEGLSMEPDAQRGATLSDWMVANSEDFRAALARTTEGSK